MMDLRGLRWMRRAGILCAAALAIGVFFIISREAGERPGEARAVNVPVQQEENRSERMDFIRSEEDFLAFARQVRAGDTYEGQYVELLTDLDFQGIEEDMAVGRADHTAYRFRGVFDGNGHGIRNLVIRSEEEAGLFPNLDGTVCNLMIESGEIEGSVCGAIASRTMEGACILNCVSYAGTRGETFDGLVGRNKGTIRNCTDSMEEMTPEALNQGLGTLGTLGGVKGWHRWDLGETGPRLTGEEANTLAHADIRLSLEGTDLPLCAYYSWLEQAWCFALPGGCEGQRFRVNLEFSDGTVRELVREPGQEELGLEEEGIFYGIRFLEGNHGPSLVLGTHVGNSLEYLHADKENRLNGSFLLLGGDGSVQKEGNVARLRGHGNDSWRSVKKSYNLTLQEAEDLLGDGAARNYTLLAGYRDNSLMAYKVTADLARELDVDFAPRTEFVQLYIDGNYLGLYFLTSKIEIGEHRFAIRDLALETERLNSQDLKLYECRSWESEESEAKMVWYELEQEPEDLTGGYILELDQADYDPLKSRFVSDRDLSVVLRSQPYASYGQVSYVADYWQEFEDALYAENGYNEQGRHYTEYIDLESFADQWLFYELNEENSLSSSVYFYKDSDETGDGLLHASYPWDMEHSLARSGYASWSWFATTREEPEDYWLQFWKHADFREAVYGEWMKRFLPAIERSLGAGYGDGADGIRTFDGYLREYGEAGALNQSRWEDCGFGEKTEKIREIYRVRKDFLTKALGLRDSEYAYFYEEDGIFYGVMEDGRETPLNLGGELEHAED